VSKGLPEGSIVRFSTINGLPGVILQRPDGSVQSVAFEIEHNRVRAIYAVSNPEKLSHLATR
jgi:RNA polymerase sigma-70 factor (ECF subfamily)